jgi:hypothetical protein
MGLRHAEARMVDGARLVYMVPGVPVAIFDGTIQLGADLAWQRDDWGAGAFQLKAVPRGIVSATYLADYREPPPPPFESLYVELGAGQGGGWGAEVLVRLDRLIKLAERRGPA